MKKSNLYALLLVTICAAAIMTSGCVPRGDQTGGGQSSAGAPYFPSGLQDVQIPDELKPDQERTLYIDTRSFSGGVRSFAGWVDPSSLTNFFKSSMPSHGWEQAGSALYSNTLLAFTKPGKTCMIVISKDAFTRKTVADIYLHVDTGGQGGMGQGGGGGIVEERIR